MKNCNTCKHIDTEKCLECFTGEEYEKRVITNYDRIKNMSVEEMAKFIPDWSYTKACKCDEEIFTGCNNECWKCVKEWLESEVEGE